MHTIQGLEKRFKMPKGWLWGHFTNARGANLRFGRLSTNSTPLAHIVYIEGLSEFAEKTFELSRDFNEMACNFSVFDRHGQGKSPRYLPDREKQHSQGVDHDIDDIIKFCNNHIPANEPIILLGHSTGGLLAALALEKEPELFQAAILVAPLFGLANKLVKNREGIFGRLPLPDCLANCYIPGGGGWTPRDAPSSNHTKAEDLSSDPVRSRISDFWMKKDKDLRTGSPTVGWVRQMCKAIMKTRKPDFARALDKPVLIFTAGGDLLVNNRHAEILAATLPKADHHHYAEGRHDLLMERDPVRRSLLGVTHKFIKKLG